jgi:hypothetical protein
VSLVNDPPDDPGEAIGDPAQYEEGRPGLSGGEDIQELVDVGLEPRLELIPVVRGEAAPDVLGVEPVLDIEAREESLPRGGGNGTVFKLSLHAVPYLSCAHVIGTRGSARSLEEPSPRATCGDPHHLGVPRKPFCGPAACAC